VQPVPRRGQPTFDLALCALLMLFGATVTMRSDAAGAGTSLDTLLLPLVILPILLRRRDPFGAAVALSIGAVVSGIPTFDQFRLVVAVPAALVILFSLASETARRAALWGLALVLAAIVFMALTDVVVRDQGAVTGAIVFSFPLCIGIWAAGRLARSRAVLAGQLAERSRMLERQREQTAELAVEIERTRLASDLDAAARARVREMIDLADSGERALGDDPKGARTAFSRIERISRESLNEMRALLGVLRSDEGGERAPRPTLAQLETLLADARAGGRLVDLEVEGERRTLPGGVELAAYRALQHLLVAVGGEDGEPAVVRLRYLPDALELEVRGFAVAAAGGGAEAALAAARERVTAHGGSFNSDHAPPGRRALRARLPVVAVHA
jgi:signal transduction histidine kinase